MAKTSKEKKKARLASEYSEGMLHFKTGEMWDPKLTDLAVNVFESEQQNREQRRKRREEQERKN